MRSVSPRHRHFTFGFLLILLGDVFCFFVFCFFVVVVFFLIFFGGSVSLGWSLRQSMLPYLEITGAVTLKNQETRELAL